jgi:hypothetical protein
MGVMNQNFFHEEIKRRLNLSSGYYHALQECSSSCLLSKIVKIKTYKAMFLLVALYGCEIWSLTLREEQEPKSVLKKFAEENIWTEGVGGLEKSA